MRRGTTILWRCDYRRGAIYRALIHRALICLIEHGRDVGNMGAMLVTWAR